MATKNGKKTKQAKDTAKRRPRSTLQARPKR